MLLKVDSKGNKREYLKVKNGIFKGKFKALTFSFDDGVLDDIRVIKIMNKYGLKGTFNLNSGVLTQTGFWNYKGKKVKHINYCDCPDLYNGHEVASHSYTHPYPDLLDYAHNDIVNQVKTDKKILECLYSQKIEGFAYPMGTYSDELIDILKANGIKYARTIISTNKFVLPENPFLWNPTCHFLDNNIQELFKEFLAEQNENIVFYIWGHSYELINNEDFKRFDDLCRFLSGRKDVDYCTNIEIINAMRNDVLS